MPNISEQQLIEMLQEQITIRTVFEQQMQHLRTDARLSMRRQQRSRYIKTLASRLTQINLLVDLWTDCMELNVDRILR